MKDELLLEGIIPQNFNWRAGISTQQKPSAFDTPGDYIETPPAPPDPFGIRAAFLAGINANKPPKVELPPIRKSKQDQYWDAIMNNTTLWKTGPEDTRPETQAELQAQQNPQMITEPLLDNTVQQTQSWNNDIRHAGEPIMVGGLPNIRF